MSEPSEERMKQLYDPNFFYEYGSDPAYKNLIDIVAHNSYKGALAEYKTLVYDKPARWFPFRNVEDFLERDMRVYSFMRSLPFWLASFAFFSLSLHQVHVMAPVGKHGYTRLSQTPFYKTWGRPGGALIIGYPLVAGYFFYRVSCFTMKKFYHHVILQERNWMHEHYKFTNPHGNYVYKDSYMSVIPTMPKDALKLMKQNSLPQPKWFEE